MAWLRFWWWWIWNNDIYPRWPEVVHRWSPSPDNAMQMLVGFRFPDDTVRGLHRSRYW